MSKSDNKFTKTFTLKQHTPLIHFQSEQIGATLRATELKPKFDKFLIKDILTDEETLKYKIKDKDALDYKVSIQEDKSKSTMIDRNELYFGNMGDGNDKHFKHNPKSFEIVFFSYHSELLEKIKDSFEKFLANTNFGTRQSKGFGSFYIKDKQFDKSFIPYKVYSFSTKDWKKDISLLYKFLRQGINLPKPTNPFYTKPAIFSYAKSKGWQWDKKTIKEHFFNRNLENQIDAHQNDVLTYSSDEKYLLRDLFGLSTSQNWKSYNVTITKSNQNINRFKSPITFKVIDNKIYFWADNSVNKILNQQFSISNGNNSFSLPTPSNFDFDDFLKFAFKIDLSKHIDNKYHNTNEYSSLSSIIDKIRNNL